MAERGYKRPYPVSNRPSAGNSRDRPRSPERVPLHKRLRREEDDHPANKLPPSLRGRVTLPGEVKDRGDEQRPPTVDRNIRGDSREQQRRQEQQSSRGRTGDRGGQQPGSNRQYERDRTVDKGTSREGPRPEQADRAQASRYDMSSSTHRTGRGGAASARFPSNMSSSSHKRPRSPGGWADHRSTAPGRPPSNSRRSGSAVRPRAVDKPVIRPESVRDPNRSESARRNGSAAWRDSSSRREQDSREDRSSSKARQNRNRSAPQQGETDSRAGRHASRPEQKSPDQSRSLTPPATAAAVEAEAPVADAGVGQQLPPPPVESPEGREEGETIPTPTGAADPAAILLNGRQEQQQQQQQGDAVANDVSSPVARLSSAGGSGKHEPIKFTLQKLPAVPADKLKPKQSSKYSLPSEQQSPVAAQHSAEKPDHRSGNHEQQQLAVRSSAGSRAQADPGRSGMSGGGDVVDRSPVQQAGRGRDFSRNRRDPPPAKQQMQQERLYQQQQYRSPDDQQERPRSDKASRPRQRREVSQDTSRDRSSAGHSSRHQQQDRPADSGRPVASEHSGYRAAASTRERAPPAVSEAVSPPGPGPAASPARPVPGSRSPRKQPQPSFEPIGVTIGPPLSKADAIQHGTAGFGLQSVNPSVMSAEGQSKTSTIQARQAGLVAVQLMGLPISRQLCFKETWEQVCKAAKVHPDVLDSEQVACQRRAKAATAVSARASKNLLMAVNPQRPVPVEIGAEEAHIKHLQSVIDSFADRTVAHNCVHLADGGSLLLPLELKGVLW